MKLCALFSGGKDSVMSIYRAMRYNKVTVLLSMLSERDDSYMYQVPNIKMTAVSAEAIGLPHVMLPTCGEPPGENIDLMEAIRGIKDTYEIEGVVAGAVRSNYQYNIVREVCHELGLSVYTPYWQRSHESLISDAIKAGFRIMIVGVAADGLDESWLGRTLDQEAFDELRRLSEKYGIDIGGEGGEYETFVYDGPIYKKRVEVIESHKIWDGVRGELVIDKAMLVAKN